MLIFSRAFLSHDFNCIYSWFSHFPVVDFAVWILLWSWLFLNWQVVYIVCLIFWQLSLTYLFLVTTILVYVTFGCQVGIVIPEISYLDIYQQISNNLTSSTKSHWIAPYFTKSQQISQYLTECHQIIILHQLSHNLAKSHIISLNLTMPHQISPYLTKSHQLYQLSLHSSESH